MCIKLPQKDQNESHDHEEKLSEMFHLPGKILLKRADKENLMRAHFPQEVYQRMDQAKPILPDVS